MKKNYFFSLWLRAFSCTTTMTMLFTALMALMTNTTKTFAQSLGTQYVAADNMDKLVGIDPSDACVAGSYDSAEPTDPSKQLCLYNIGTKRFLSVGGYYGTHAALDNTPHTLWFERVDNAADYNDTRFWINNHVAGSGTGTHLGCENSTNSGHLYMDHSNGNDGIDGHNGLDGNNGATTFRFVKAPDYTETNKVYYLIMNRYVNSKWWTFYVSAFPNNEACDCNIYNYTNIGSDADYKNKEWKIITRKEYYQLTLLNPANMVDVIDLSFLIKSPNFRVNDTDASNWKATNNGADKIFFGDNSMYKTFAKRDALGGREIWTKFDGGHQEKYGKLFYSYARGAMNFDFYQDIQVHKAGWYLLRCNGFTTQVNKDGKVSARLMMAVMTADGKFNKTAGYSAATLNKLSLDDAKALMQNDATGQGAGRAFFDGKYENQVQVCLEEKELGKIDNDHPVTLRIGYYVGDDCELQDGDVTCVDNFKLLYAGPRRNPELILDEDQPSLVYLSNAKDVYKNSVLHLKRTFTENQWNSLILPVDLKFGQMKRTFGDDVKVAKLHSLKDNVVIFRTVEPKQDNEVMVKAFEPYIIKPTSLTGDLGLEYTAEEFHTRVDKTTGEISNAYLLGKDGKSECHDPNDCFKLTIPQNHYDIFMVTLNRDSLIKHLNFSEEYKTYYDNGEYNKINWDNVSWISQTRFSTGAKEGDLTCYGTLTKTYGKDDNGKDVILPGRDDLSDDYVMRGGKIVHVPSDKDYGLKGFRCWFEVKGSHPIAAAPRLEIDGIIDDATSIDDLNSQPSQFTSRHKGISGVFNLDGQKVRDGESTQDLPKGIYIVNGRKVVVR